jgi:hypothetical protein
LLIDSGALPVVVLVEFDIELSAKTYEIVPKKIKRDEARIIIQLLLY